ncbi:MAG: GNAT family N-acetyltransferase [Anaerolineae bacterium]
MVTADRERAGVQAAHNVDRSVEVYNRAVRDTFGFLKQTDRLDDLFAKAIPLGDGDGFLMPVCELHADQDDLIAALAQWRAENSFAFPSQFPVTVQGTASWLRSRVLDVEDRMLFLVLDEHGHLIGHLGFANAINSACEMEVDNVVRGVKGAAAGLMSRAMQAALDWAEEMIGPERIFLRVFSDNEHAATFYRRLGFRDDAFLPLRKQVEGDAVLYVSPAEGDVATPDKQFLRMVYSPEHVVDGSQLILTAGPSIGAREASYALDAARYGWRSRWNGYLTRFEQTLADYLGAKYALATSSCTGALHVALAALGIGPGDEVIVPDMTWVATANAVLLVGATPVFADIEPGSWCLDPEAIEPLVGERTKAIVPVHLYGHPARMDRITEVARRHGLYVVEDAAPSIGAECLGQKVGTFGDFSAFSFQGAKVAVTGEGGMLVTSDEELYQRAYTIWDQGRVPGTFWINQRGLKYKMANVQAAIGLGQIERIDRFVEAKRRIFRWYADGLSGLSHIHLNQEMPWARSIYWMTSLILDEGSNLTRDQLRQSLKERNVDTRSVFPAVSQYPIWPSQQASQPVALRVAGRALNLPSGVCLKREEVSYICKCICEALS